MNLSIICGRFTHDLHRKFLFSDFTARKRIILSRPQNNTILVPVTELYYISGDRAPDRKVSPKTWRILRHNRPTFMGASTDQWLKCPCATEFNPP